MKTGTPWIAGSVIGLALVGPGAAPDSAAQTNRQLAQHAGPILQKVNASPFQKFTVVKGAGAASALPSTKAVWVSVLKAPGDNLGGAGFKLVPLSVGGTLQGAKAKATFNVTEVVGDSVSMYLGICEGACNGLITNTWGPNPLTAPGSHTLTTDPITLEPGKNYVILAVLQASGSRGSSRISGAVGTISEIKWEF